MNATEWKKKVSSKQMKKKFNLIFIRQIDK